MGNKISIYIQQSSDSVNNNYKLVYTEQRRFYKHYQSSQEIKTIKNYS